jgi:hypothetical protein
MRACRRLTFLVDDSHTRGKCAQALSQNWNAADFEDYWICKLCKGLSAGAAIGFQRFVQELMFVVDGDCLVFKTKLRTLVTDNDDNGNDNDDNDSVNDDHDNDQQHTDKDVNSRAGNSESDDNGGDNGDDFNGPDPSAADFAAALEMLEDDDVLIDIDDYDDNEDRNNDEMEAELEAPLNVNDNEHDIHEQTSRQSVEDSGSLPRDLLYLNVTSGAVSLDNQIIKGSLHDYEFELGLEVLLRFEKLGDNPELDMSGCCVAWCS